MNAPRYIQKNLANQHQKDQEYKNHMKRLQEIKTKRSKTLSSNPSSSLDLKSKNQIRFLKQQMEKLNVINKENEVLLGRLVDINQGKSKRFTSNDPAEAQAVKMIQKKADLSDIQRKIQDQKLKEENTQLVKRLIERIQKNEQLSKDQRARAISEYLKQRKLMQKYNYQAEPPKLNISTTNENNLSTDQNENSRQLKGNNIFTQEDVLNTGPGGNSGDLKLPPLLNHKNNIHQDNDVSHRSYSSKQVLKGTQKNSISHDINNQSINSGSANKYASTKHGSNENNTMANSQNSTIINQNQKRQTNNSTQKYEYIEQNSAMYHYEDNKSNQTGLKSNSSQKSKAREKHILNNILQECYPKSEQEKTQNSIDRSKQAKNTEGQASRVIQTNESTENINVSKLKHTHHINKSQGAQTLKTNEDIDSNNPTYGVSHPLKINNTMNNNQSKSNKQYSNYTHRQQTHNIQKTNNNSSLMSISSNNPTKISHNKNPTVGQPISNKQSSIPLNQLRSSSERVELDSNQKVYKDKRRVSTNVLQEKGYDGEPQQVSVNKSSKAIGSQDDRTIISKRNSTKVINEEIQQDETIGENQQIPDHTDSQYQQDFEVEEEDDQGKDGKKPTQAKQKNERASCESYNFYSSNQESPQKSNNRYKQDNNKKTEQVEEEELIVDEDHDLDL